MHSTGSSKTCERARQDHVHHICARPQGRIYHLLDTSCSCLCSGKGQIGVLPTKPQSARMRWAAHVVRAPPPIAIMTLGTQLQCSCSARCQSCTLASGLCLRTLNLSVPLCLSVLRAPHFLHPPHRHRRRRQTPPQGLTHQASTVQLMVSYQSPAGSRWLMLKRTCLPHPPPSSIAQRRLSHARITHTPHTH